MLPRDAEIGYIRASMVRRGSGGTQVDAPKGQSIEGALYAPMGRVGDEAEVHAPKGRMKGVHA